MKRRRCAAAGSRLRFIGWRVDRRPGGERRREALRLDRLVAPRARAARQARAARSPTRTSPGSAALLEARSGVHRLAGDREVAARWVASTSPVSIPIRTDSPLVERADAARQGERRGDRAVGVVAVGLRHPEDRHDGVADVLLDRAAVLGRASRARRRRTARAAGEAPRGRGSRPARSTRRGPRRRSSPACARRRSRAESGAPQDGQKRASSSAERPHRAQSCTMAGP